MEQEQVPDTNYEAPKSGKKIAKSKTPLLDLYGRNLTELAKRGELDPVYGRDKELDDIIFILNKRKKNNPMLIGDPGVGKTVIVELLAQKIADNDVEMWLLNKKIIELSPAGIVSGTKFRGEFEEKMVNILKEIKENKDIIVFIDEIHNMVGSGGSSGSLDGANIIKTALSNGDMRCIGATTTDEYKKYIESEGAFVRRFQNVSINEPNVATVTKLLMDIKWKYEEFHGVKYTKEAIVQCVTLADKYLTYRKFPDKAIDLLDEVGSLTKIKEIVTPESLILERTKLDEITKSKEEASKKQDFESAAMWRDEERKLFTIIEDLEEKFRKTTSKNKIKVKLEHIAAIISSHTGIPVTKLTESETKKLKVLSESLKSVVIGQDNASELVADAIKKAKLGFNDPNKPIASFLFLGSTGVGKTYLAKTLAKVLFNTKDSFIRFDMSEYKESYSLSKLIGSPPGYIGHDEKGLLTEKIKNKPYSIVLLDEIEKAHPSIFNLFLQILDDGILTDSLGSVIDFKNTIIIMTTNIGTKSIVNNTSVGFGAQDENLLKVDTLKVIKSLEKEMSPEFINRIDEKIVFNPLSKKDIQRIVDIEIVTSMKRVAEKGYKIAVSKDVVKYIGEIGFDKRYGARPLKRAISDKLIGFITKEIINEAIKKQNKYSLYMDKDEIKLKLINDARN